LSIKPKDSIDEVLQWRIRFQEVPKTEFLSRFGSVAVRICLFWGFEKDGVGYLTFNKNVK